MSQRPFEDRWWFFIYLHGHVASNVNPRGVRAPRTHIHGFSLVEHRPLPLYFRFASSPKAKAREAICTPHPPPTSLRGKWKLFFKWLGLTVDEAIGRSRLWCRSLRLWCRSPRLWSRSPRLWCRSPLFCWTSSTSQDYLPPRTIKLFSTRL